MHKNIKNKLDQAFTVGDLIEQLQELDPKMPVGRAGHFGEANLIDADDLCVRECYLTASLSWRDDNRHYLNILDITTPDIGPDPD